ncbi:MAG: dimethylamine methyltransferase [Methanomassiliicoccus sp.]|nr:MAG: dimethylamine methyltransferase [Methanomassiliicoccus sp.]
MGKVEDILKELKVSVETWNTDLAIKAVNNAKEAGISPFVAIEAGLGRGMITISVLFDEGKIYLPQVLAASQTMQKAMEMLGPLDLSHSWTKGIVVLGTVQGDIHEIGKHVIKAFLRGGGYTVFDLGKDVPTENFIAAIKEHQADIVGASALMTTTLIGQRQLVETLKEENLSQVKTIFGGAPCTQKWVDSISGDGYCSSGADVIELVHRMMGE